MNLSRLSLVLVSAAQCAIVASSAAAQTPRPKWKDCVDSIPDRDLRPVAVFIATSAEDSAPAHVKSADFFIDTLAARMRVAMGAAEGHLAVGEPGITRRNLGGAVRVTLYRSGEFAWRVTHGSASDTTRDLAVGLLADALEKLKKEGKRIPWPDRAQGDSAAFRIFFTYPRPARDGSAKMLNERYGAPVLAVAVPWSDPVIVTKLVRPRYPEAGRRGLAESSVVLRFLVDENGRVDKSSIHVNRDPRIRAYSGDLAELDALFVEAAMQSVIRSEYRPMTIAGCKVPETVLQPFDFLLSR